MLWLIKIILSIKLTKSFNHDTCLHQNFRITSSKLDEYFVFTSNQNSTNKLYSEIKSCHEDKLDPANYTIYSGGCL